MKLKWHKKKTAVITVLEVWSYGGITRTVIWDSIRGLVTLEMYKVFHSRTRILAW